MASGVSSGSVSTNVGSFGASGTQAPHASESKPNFSKTFNFFDGDITLKSVDNVLFRVHRHNLSVGARVFQDMFATAQDDGSEPVGLTELASTLEKLLSFFYEDLHPDVSAWTLAEAFDIAESARKYQAAGIRQILRFRMAYELQKVRASTIAKEPGSARPNPKLVFGIFGFAHASAEANLANSAALLLLDVDPFGLKPYSTADDAAWHALRMFLAARRGAVTAAMSSVNLESLCLSTFQRLSRALKQMHLDPTYTPSGCAEKYCGGNCHSTLKTLQARLQSFLPAHVYTCSALS